MADKLKIASSCEENNAKPVPVGFRDSVGVRSVQNAVGRQPYWVYQDSSSLWVVSWGKLVMNKIVERSERNACKSKCESCGCESTSGCSSRGWDFVISAWRTRTRIDASSIARLGARGAWWFELMGSISSATQMDAKVTGWWWGTSGWCEFHLLNSLRRSNIRGYLRYTGREIPLSWASRGMLRRISQEFKLTIVNSSLREIKWSSIERAKRVIAFWKVPAPTRVSQVSVVWLVQKEVTGVFTGLTRTDCLEICYVRNAGDIQWGVIEEYSLPEGSLRRQ